MMVILLLQVLLKCLEEAITTPLVLLLEVSILVAYDWHICLLTINCVLPSSVFPLLLFYFFFFQYYVNIDCFGYHKVVELCILLNRG